MHLNEASLLNNINLRYAKVNKKEAYFTGSTITNDEKLFKFLQWTYGRSDKQYTAVIFFTEVLFEYISNQSTTTYQNLFVIAIICMFV